MKVAAILLLVSALIISRCYAATYEVIAGQDNGEGFVAMQFFPQVVSITTGDSVRFVVRVQGDGVVRSTDVMYSSGLLAQDQEYTFTFPTAGTFPFHCSIHQYMTGKIQVVDTQVPRDPASVSTEAQSLYQKAFTVIPNITRDYKLDLYRTNHPRRKADGQPSYTEHHVLVGAGDITNLISYMRFTPTNLTIEVGDAILFDVVDPVGPHTLAFNVSGVFDDADLVAPDGTRVAPGFYFRPFGNPFTYFENFLSAGLISSPILDIPGYNNFTVHFVKPGVYPYMCNLHKDMGMRGVITVVAKNPKVKHTAGIVIWSILGGLFVIGMIVLVLFLIIRAIFMSDD